MSAITLYEYLAFNVPSQCQGILDRYDIPASQNAEELTENVKAYVRVYGQEALEELAAIHPDKDLIAEMTSYSTPYEGKQDSEYLNASGRIDDIEQRLMNGNNGNALSKSDVLLGLGVAILTVSLFNK